MYKILEKLHKSLWEQIVPNGYVLLINVPRNIKNVTALKIKTRIMHSKKVRKMESPFAYPFLFHSFQSSLLIISNVQLLKSKAIVF